MSGIRYCNDGNTAAYTAALQSGTLPPGTAEELNPATRRTELLGLLLRTDEGLPAHMLRTQDAAFVTMLQSEQLATLAADGRLILTRAGRLVADEIAVGVIEPSRPPGRILVRPPTRSRDWGGGCCIFAGR